jgi:hypothetical protein
MKTHKQLTEGQRVQIAALKKAGNSNVGGRVAWHFA